MERNSFLICAHNHTMILDFTNHLHMIKMTVRNMHTKFQAYLFMVRVFDYLHSSNMPENNN